MVFLGITGTHLSPIIGFIRGAQAVCGAFFWSRIKIGINGLPKIIKKLNNFGLQSIIRKIAFLIGESPIYSAEISLARINISRIDTPDGQADWHEPQSKQRSSFSRTALGSSISWFAKLESSASLPRVTSASFKVSVNTGQTDWHVPQRIHFASLSSSAFNSATKFFKLAIT